MRGPIHPSQQSADVLARRPLAWERSPCLCGGRAAVKSTASRPSRARAQRDEKVVELFERFAQRIRRPGAGSVESFLKVGDG
jgi:hypothetical protein